MNNRFNLKTIISVILLFLSVVAFPENNTSLNSFSLNELQSSDQVQQTTSISIIKPANRFTCVEAGITYSGTLKFAFTTLNEVKPWFTYGFGLGVRYYTHEEKILVPVFANLQANIPLKSKILPYLSVKPGYSLGGGFLINPELGINIKLSDKKSVQIGVGYEYCQIGKDYYDRDVENSIGLTLGLRF